MADILLELYCEEIPALMQANAKASFKQIFANLFDQNSISYEELKLYISPSRIVLNATGLPIELSESEEEIKGPKVGTPDGPLEGFCRSNNINRNDLVVKTIKDQEYYFAVIKRPAKKIAEILLAKLPHAITSYTWPKSMFWGNHELEWVRPLKNILCLFNNEILPLEIGHLKANNITFGHKFMSPNAIEVISSTEYFTALKNAKVLVNDDERKQIITEGLTKLCNEHNIILNEDGKLLEEVIGLSDYPVVLKGNIPERFMTLPAEVLITSMRNHQKYFTANSKTGTLAPYFLFVTNLDLANYYEVISGNQKVLNARLSDALYFYHQDQQHPLISRLDKLKNVVFHAKLGTIAQKVERLVYLTAFIEPGNNDLVKAAELAKCDLATEMVSEFPELQGIMGSYYAKIEGFSTKTAEAIKNHYKPNGAEEEVPHDSGGLLALADKLDSLTGLYLAGERATGSKDPYALRRYALGVIRIVITNKLNLSLKALISYSASLYKDINFDENSLAEIQNFIEERLKHFYKNTYPTNIINAVISLKLNDNILALENLLKEFAHLYNTETGQELVALYKRASNILASENLTDLAIDSKLFQAESEHDLWDAVKQADSQVTSAIKTLSYKDALTILASLKPALSKFFDDVLVNTDEPNIAKNRKALLWYVVRICKQIANFEAL